MGTNFYLSKDDQEEQIHLGKRYGGGFYYRGTHDVTDHNSWCTLIRNKCQEGWRIVSENNEDMGDPEEFIQHILTWINNYQNSSWCAYEFS